MQKRPPYIIEILSLKEGEHHFEFTLKDEFLDQFSRKYIETLHEAQIKVVLQKSKRMIDSHLWIRGSLPLQCDRCLEPYDHLFEEQLRIIFSYDRSFKGEKAIEVRYIATHERFLDFGQDIYDVICLSVPQRRVPDFHDCEDFIAPYRKPAQKTYSPHYWQPLKELLNKNA